jgi:acetate kinase
VQQRRILCIDRGSSSLKIAVYDVGAASEQLLIAGAVERLGEPEAMLQTADQRAADRTKTNRSLGSATPLEAVLAMLSESGMRVDAVGHRLVYGGARYEEPERVDAALLASLGALVPFDPLHLLAALDAIREIEGALPGIEQVVCFDTAFHRQMPSVAKRLPLPRDLWREGLQRYGFHGLSYESIVRALGSAGTRGAMIVAHLGSGASLAAMRNGKPVDTTMGFSPLGGVMMGTRPGDLDPGALLYLMRDGRYTPERLGALLTEQSGLLGVSGISSDMEMLLARRAENEQAAEAVQLFVYQAKKHLGALVAVLGGLDTLVFTGGIGERSAVVRAEICAGLAHLGIALDPERNDADAEIVSAHRAHVVVRVIRANENQMVARHTFATLKASEAVN